MKKQRNRKILEISIEPHRATYSIDEVGMKECSFTSHKKMGFAYKNFARKKTCSHRSRDRFYFLLHLSFDRHMLNNRFRRFASFSSTREIYLCFTSSIIWKAELAEAKIFHFKCKICGMKIILTVKINFFDGKSQSLSWKQFNAEKFWAKWNSFNEICLLFLLFFSIINHFPARPFEWEKKNANTKYFIGFFTCIVRIIFAGILHISIQTISVSFILHFSTVSFLFKFYSFSLPQLCWLLCFYLR